MVLSKKQVLELLSISPATLDRWEANCPGFPKRFHLGNGQWKKAYWREAEIREWL